MNKTKHRAKGLTVSPSVGVDAHSTHQDLQFSNSERIAEQNGGLSFPTAHPFWLWELGTSHPADH